MVKECTTVNGNATLVLNEATFADCIILQSVIMEEAKKLKKYDKKVIFLFKWV